MSILDEIIVVSTMFLGWCAIWGTVSTVKLMSRRARRQ